MEQTTFQLGQLHDDVILLQLPEVVVNMSLAK